VICSKARLEASSRAQLPVRQSLEPVIDGRFNEAGFREVVGHDFRLARHDAGKALLKCTRNLTMQLMPAALKQALIGRIPHQRVLEVEDRFWRLAPAEYKSGMLELGDQLRRPRHRCPVPAILLQSLLRDVALGRCVTTDLQPLLCALFVSST
jgi:hypothetical protein